VLSGGGLDWLFMATLGFYHGDRDGIKELCAWHVFRRANSGRDPESFDRLMIQDCGVSKGMMQRARSSKKTPAFRCSRFKTAWSSQRSFLGPEDAAARRPYQHFDVECLSSKLAQSQFFGTLSEQDLNLRDAGCWSSLLSK
jgi:hypothetical protein